MTRFLGLFIAATLASAPAYAGKDPCKGVKVKEAKGTGTITRSAEAGDLKLFNIKGMWTFGFSFNQGGGYGGFVVDNRTVLPAGSPMNLVMMDGSTLELKTDLDATATPVTIMGVTVSNYNLRFTLDEESVKMLTQQPAKGFEIMHGAEVFKSDKIGKGDGAKFAEMGACMLNTAG